MSKYIFAVELLVLALPCRLAHQKLKKKKTKSAMFVKTAMAPAFFLLTHAYVCTLAKKWHFMTPQYLNVNKCFRGKNRKQNRGQPLKKDDTLVCILNFINDIE